MKNIDMCVLYECMLIHIHCFLTNFLIPSLGIHFIESESNNIFVATHSSILARKMPSEESAGLDRGVTKSLHILITQLHRSIKYTRYERGKH